MGKWLKKIGRKAKKVAKKAGEKILHQAGDILGQDNMDGWTESFNVISEKGGQCAQVSGEAVQICDDTAEKRDQMIAFASEIRSTLTQLTTETDNPAAILETIKDMTDGSKVREAMELAQGLDEAAITCLAKSKEMIDLMEDCTESLPNGVLDAVEYMVGNDDDDDDDDDDELDPKVILKDLDKDMDDVKLCIESIRKLNLSTALQVGLDAFTQLSDKAVRTKTLFNSLRTFAADVQDITTAFQEMDLSEISSRSSDLFRCLHLCDGMREIASGAGQLLKLLISLFQSTADRISSLWSALAFAKDCMTDCVAIVQKTITLIGTAKDTSLDLVDKSRSIYDELSTLSEGRMDMKSIQSVRALAAEDGEINRAIALATNMDDMVVDCHDQVTAMIARVSEGFQNIPDILTEGMDLEATNDEDDQPADLQADVEHMQACTRDLEQAGMVSLMTSGTTGFESVTAKSEVCQTNISRVKDFTANCESTIHSFLHEAWDLDAASRKLKEMCRMVQLGKLIQECAGQIKNLAVVLVEFMTLAMEKLSQPIQDSMAEAATAVEDAVEDAVDTLADKFGDKIGGKLGGKLGKIAKFW